MGRTVCVTGESEGANRGAVCVIGKSEGPNVAGTIGALGENEGADVTGSAVGCTEFGGDKADGWLEIGAVG